jgi:hypothetical protein
MLLSRAIFLAHGQRSVVQTSGGVCAPIPLKADMGADMIEGGQVPKQASLNDTIRTKQR